MQWAALALVAFAAPPTLSPPERPVIFGGQEVDEGELLDVVAVRAGNTLCSGVLVAPTIVLTAAHCLDDELPPSLIRVIVGHDVNNPELGSPHIATRYGLHPDFCGGDCQEDAWDFGYIELPSPVDVGVAPLVTDQATYDDLFAVGGDVWLVGFGEDEAGIQGIKRSVSTSLRKLSSQGTEFLAGQDGKDSCTGDSGGPAYAIADDGTRHLIGILSRGYECGDGGFYGNPYVAACWLRDETGVELVGDCSACDCLTLGGGAEAQGDCGRCHTRSGTRADDWVGAIVAAVMVGWARTRRRKR